MKKAAVLIMLLWLGMCSTAFAQAPGAPAVIRATWNASPGDAIGIYGADFIRTGEETQVLLFPVHDAYGQGQAVMAHRVLRILNMDDGVIQAEIPEDMAKDQYLGFVKTGTQYSQPFLINTPQADWLSDPEICAGQTVRLFGRNLLHPADDDRSATHIWLCDPETEAEIAAPVQSVTPYTVDFIVPQEAVPGTRYTVKVQTGRSSYASAWLADDEAVLCVENTNFQSAKTQYGVELGWAARLNMENTFNVRDFGAAGDGAADDVQAVQAAIAAAKAAGGGKIYFPAGTYNLTSLANGITIPEHSVFAGDGQTQSILKIDKRVSGAAGCSGITGLTLRSELLRPADNTARLIAGYVGSLIFASNPEARFFMQDVGLYAADGSSFASYENKQIIIENCHFDITHQGPMVQNNNLYTRVNLRFRNNYVRNTQRSMIWCGGHSWIEGCTFNGENGGDNCEKGENGQAATMEHRISEMWGDKVFYGNNLVTGTIGDQRPGHDDNSGEGVCNQSTCIIALDTARTADAQTITGDTDFDAVQQGEDPVAQKRGLRLIGAKVAVISGRGLGQVRRVAAATGNTLTLDRPWTVVPGPGDVFTVDGNMTERYIIVNNQIEAKTRKGGIMLYNKSYDNVIENNVLTNSGGIWFGKAQEPAQKRSAIAYFNYVGGNQLSGGVNYKEGGARDGALSIGPGDDGGTVMTSDREINGVSQFANLYRDNVIQGNGTELVPKSQYNGNFVRYNGFVVSTPDSGTGTEPMARGLILDGNTATNSVNGVTLSSTASRTLLYKNNFSGNGTDYHDSFSRNTVVVHENGEAEAWKGPAYVLQDVCFEKTADTVGRVFQSAPVQIGDQRYLYIAGGGGLSVYCVTDGVRLVQNVQDALVSTYCYGIEVHDGYLYYAVNSKFARKLYIYAIAEDGTITPDEPVQQIGITATGFTVAGDYLIICQESNGAAVYDIKTWRKLSAFAGKTAIRSIKLERLDADRYRIYYITQTPYTETIDGTVFTCNETFHIAELENGNVAPLFSGRPQNGPWPGFGAYQSVGGLSANWGNITILDTNIIQLNPNHAGFENMNLVIDASDPAVPVIAAAYTNTVAVRDMVKLKPHVFAGLSVKGDLNVWDYSDIRGRKACMAEKHAILRSGTDIDILGNTLYIMSDVGFAVYGIVDLWGTTVSAPYLDYGAGRYSADAYTIYCDMSSAVEKELQLAVAEYADNKQIGTINFMQFPMETGNSRIAHKFAAEGGGTRMKILFWDNMIPVREATILYP